MDRRRLEGLFGLYVGGPYSTSLADRPITRRDVRALEAKLGHRLPEDYTTFLLEYKEGAVHFARPVRFRPPGDEITGWVYIDAFFSLRLGKSAPGYDLWTNYRMHQGIIPAYLLPIIGNSLGSYACVAIAGPRLGAVFYWEHELIDYDSEEPTDAGLFFVAPSFDAFLGLLEVYEPSD
jgi:hypothetical protein